MEPPFVERTSMPFLVPVVKGGRHVGRAAGGRTVTAGPALWLFISAASLLAFLCFKLAA